MGTNNLTNGGNSQRGFDLDVRGVIALLVVVGVFMLAFAQLFVAASRGSDFTGPEVIAAAAAIPAWAAAVVGGVTGFYFGSRSSTDTGAIAGIQAASKSAASTASSAQQQAAQEQIVGQAASHWAETEIVRKLNARIATLEQAAGLPTSETSTDSTPDTPL